MKLSLLSAGNVPIRPRFVDTCGPMMLEVRYLGRFVPERQLAHVAVDLGLGVLSGEVLLDAVDFPEGFELEAMLVLDGIELPEGTGEDLARAEVLRAEGFLGRRHFASFILVVLLVVVSSCSFSIVGRAL